MKYIYNLRIGTKLFGVHVHVHYMNIEMDGHPCYANKWSLIT